MNKRLLTPLIPPLGGRMAQAGIAMLFAVTVSVGAKAQTDNEDVTQLPRNLNSELRTHTWSVYAQGGLSWSTGVWYPNLDAKRSYKLSPAVGGGVDFTIRPWVRVGAEYLYSRYRREQQFSALAPTTMPVKAYGNYLINYHNVKLGAQFNFMELWRKRRAQWFNVWVGTGVGYMLAKGNESGTWFSSTLTQNGRTVPLISSGSFSNDSELLLKGNVRTTNRHEKFNKLYIPATIHAEADVSRRFTVGLKGEIDWVLNRKDIAPKNNIFALATVRYNFVSSRAKVLKDYYEEEVSKLNEQTNVLRQEVEAERDRAAREAAERARLEQENAELQRKLADSEARNSESAVTMQPAHFVQFSNNSSYFNREEGSRLKSFAKSVQGKKLKLVAEASTPGTDSYNQHLSERRLRRVIKTLVAEGFSPNDLNPQIAIGEKNGKPTAEGRRVTIFIEK